MDNASKALILAGGILIAVMIIGVALLILNNARQFAKTADTQARINAVQSFNRYYQSALNSNGKILGINVLNIKNKSLDDKNVYGYNIEVSVPQSVLNGLNAATGAELMNREFNCEFDGYDSDGYITHITIK